jgi:hypothetical protein
VKVSRFWLRYQSAGRLLGVLIVDFNGVCKPAQKLF